MSGVTGMAVADGDCASATELVAASRRPAPICVGKVLISLSSFKFECLSEPRGRVAEPERRQLWTVDGTS
jgi:hypothetical protein